MSKIKIDNLSFSYDEEKTLENLSLIINEPSINVFLGLNGCGKTTLLKILSGLIIPKDNSVFIFDKSIKEISKKEIVKYIAFVPQLTSADNDFIVEDYLLFSFVSKLKFYEAPNSDQINKMHIAANKFEIDGLLKKKMNEISGGELQKILICAAYIQDTPIIILDEPLSALDLKNQGLVINIIRDLYNEGKIIILSTHNPNIALYLNANVFLLIDGKISSFGKAKDIIKKDILTAIYGSQIVYSKEHDYDEISIK